MVPKIEEQVTVKVADMREQHENTLPHLCAQQQVWALMKGSRLGANRATKQPASNHTLTGLHSTRSWGLQRRRSHPGFRRHCIKNTSRHFVWQNRPTVRLPSGEETQRQMQCVGKKWTENMKTDTMCWFERELLNFRKRNKSWAENKDDNYKEGGMRGRRRRTMTRRKTMTMRLGSFNMPYPRSPSSAYWSAGSRWPPWPWQSCPGPSSCCPSISWQFSCTPPSGPWPCCLPCAWLPGGGRFFFFYIIKFSYYPHWLTPPLPPLSKFKKIIFFLYLFLIFFLYLQFKKRIFLFWVEKGQVLPNMY